MSITTHTRWDGVAAAVEEAVSIAWDGCHKVYVLMDEGQHDQMQSYGYDPLIRVESIGAEEALELLRDWYDESCALRFISAIKTVDSDPNDGFTDLIPQFDEDEDE